ncbi:MAG: carbohydrate ABC transporter permease [Anaerolineales bacterium]|nr:carbohydrate ABC transporter permease [Anaerolineales bacterium]
MIRKYARIGFSLLITILYAMPLYLAFVNVFKTQEQITRRPIELPAPFTFDNINSVINRPDNLLFEGLKNSFLITIISVLILNVLSAVIGYHIARHDNVYPRIILLCFMAGLMIPPQVILIPIVQLFKALNIIGTYFALILYFSGGGLLSFGVFVYTGFIKTIPRELDEAALIDGASSFQLFWRVIFPILRPATATASIFLSLWIWNEFLTPLIILGPSQGITITTGIYFAIGQYTIDYGQMFALMFLSSLPMLIFFFAMQKEFISGLTSGALKG